MTELVNKVGDNTVSSFSYQYSLDGKQTAKTDMDGITTHYSYDLIDQLVGEKQTVKGTDDEGEEIDVETANISYSYDWFGNRTETVATGYPVYTKTCVYDDGNRLISETHTQDGETVTTTHSYDDNGNLMRSESSDGKVVTRNYNGFNWQTDYVSADVSLWFRYLPNGLRYSKQKRTNSTCTVTTHHWDGSDIVMDVSQNGTVKGRYLRGNGKLIAEDIAGSYSYYFFNAHGDVINRVNSDGVVLKTYKYDSFGNIINPATVGDPNDPIYTDQSPFGYAGEYLDKENGEIYLRARYYSSANGRFVTEDPSQHGPNWYIYCDNNPVTKVDRTGLRPTTDGSAGSDKIANDYMIATYYKQQASAHPEMTQPAPEPPKTTRGKWSKNTFKTELPVNFRYYNVDRTEFEPPFDIENTIAKPDIDNNEDIKTNGTGLQEFVESATSTVTIDKMSETATEFWANSIVRHSVLEVAKTFDDILRFTPIVGTALDASLRVFQGEELHHAANKAMIVTLTVSAVTIGIVSAGFAVPMFPIMVLLSVFIDLVVSSVYDKLFKN